MDPFTEKLLERTRARRENLQKKKSERPSATKGQISKRPRDPLSESNSTIRDPHPNVTVPQAAPKPSPSKRKCSEENLPSCRADEENKEPLTLHDPHTDKKPPVGPVSVRTSQSETRPGLIVDRVEIRPDPESERNAVAHVASSSEEQRMEVQISQTQSGYDDDDDGAVEVKSAPAVTGMRSRLQMLADQRKNWDSTDPAPDCPPPSMLKRHDVLPSPTSSSMSTPLGRKGRLANLAATIGSWEDDMNQANIPKGTTEKAPQMVRPAPIEASPRKAEAPSSPTSPAPQKISQKDLLDSCSPHKEHHQPVAQSPMKTLLPSTKRVQPSPHKPDLRPRLAELSSSSANTSTGAPSVKSFLERFGEKCQERVIQGSPVGGRSQSKTPAAAVTPNTRLVQEKLRTATKTTSADLTQRQKMERESELALIRNRFQKATNMWKNKDEGTDRTSSDATKTINTTTQSELFSSQMDEPTAPPGEKSHSPKDFLGSPPASTSSPLKPVRPTEDTERARDDEQRGEKQERDEKMRGEESEEPSEKDVSEKNVDGSVNGSITSAVINELFEGVLQQSDEEEEEDALNISSMSLLAPLAETVAAVSKSPDSIMTSTPATSFIVKSPVEKTPKTKLRRSLSSDSIHVVSPEHRLPYSIDAYRSTRVKDTERPSLKQVIVRKENVSEKLDEQRSSGLFSLKQKIKVLTNEMNMQQTVIHQASQALNCCTDEEHGKGSQVEAEAERLLLVATEKREAVKAELDRLKGAPCSQRKEQSGLSATRGSIVLHELRLPLKADFVCSTANRPEASTKHSFFVMIRAGAESMVATPLASTHRSLSGDTLTFPTKFTMSDVSSDFQILLEVYCLVQKRELCPDKKKKLSKSKVQILWQTVYEAHDLCLSAITPKRFLAITKSGQTPVVASPGGPGAVRTSNFMCVGSHTLTLSSIGKNQFPLEKVPFLCPLEGHIYMKIQCDVGSNLEEHGFLTMFEDVSGFGAWHRRWCVLSGYCISYWTYPDDEKRKNPIGRINLANCVSKKVEPANREFCARPNTFELITARPQREDDQETLTSSCSGTMCVTKNWLSADTKDERNLWMKKLNQILVDLRMWKPDACCKSL